MTTPVEKRFLDGLALDIERRFGPDWRKLFGPLVQEALVQSAVMDMALAYPEGDEPVDGWKKMRELNLAALRHLLPEMYAK